MHTLTADDFTGTRRLTRLALRRDRYTLAAWWAGLGLFVAATTAMFGEVGLAGEVRGISQAPLRVREAAQMGFRRCIMPEANIEPNARLKPSRSEGAFEGECELVGVRTVGEALDALLA